MGDTGYTGPACPLPFGPGDRIQMAHGGGGGLTHRLIEEVFRRAFSNATLDQRHDSAVVHSPGSRLAFTTDSYVVRPLFFPGGDIGSLSIHGTVNDLAMAGARPLWIGAGFILEEGLPIETLAAVARSMGEAARRCGVAVVTGDTKVVERGKGDGIYINTSGVGVIEHDLEIGPGRVQPGDAVLLSGDVGRHGMAVMASREGFDFETCIESDSAPVSGMVLDLLEAGIEVRCLRDLTRGGLATAACEITQTSGIELALREEDIPVDSAVATACEVLGFDPLYVANEGRFLAFVAPGCAKAALEILRRHEAGARAACIGVASACPAPRLVLETAIGGRRLLDLLSGEQLPRIC